MDVENRRIVLSIAERLKELDQEEQAEFLANHPRRDDIEITGDEGSSPEDEQLASEIGPPVEEAPEPSPEPEAAAAASQESDAPPAEAETPPGDSAAEEKQ